MQISQRAIDLIVAAEVSSRATYEKKYRRPEWPGGLSGVTVAIGYDVGYANIQKLHADWDGRISSRMIDALALCCGVSGEAARRLLPSVRDQVDVPWQPAMDVFMTRDMPQWISKVCRAIPGAEKLSPDCLGALTSLAYNRGASFTLQGDRYREMRAIREHVMAGDYERVPDEIRAMKRLWPSQRGLLIRRDAEADLFADGLKRSSPPATDPVRKEHVPPLKPPPKAGKEEAGGTAGPIVIGGEAARQAAEAGYGPGVIVAIVAVAVVLGIVAYVVIRKYRTREIEARQKG